MIVRLLSCATAVGALACGSLAIAEASPAQPIVFPDRFDSIGSPVESLVTREGRTVHYTDTAETGWTPMLFVGGVGTSGRAAEMVAFLDTMRKRLKVRIITVERNGLGDTAFDQTWTMKDYTSEVRQVLDKLDVKRFSLVAISGGGPYAGHIVQAMPERLASWHMLAAGASAPASWPACGADEATLQVRLEPQIAAPRVWWDLPRDGVASKVRGFTDRAADEGARAFFIAGQKGDPRAAAREYKRFCDSPADVAAYKGPSFFYYGEADTQVPPSQGEFWAAHVKGKVSFRRYPGEGHDVQYRHWDQVLLDVAGYGGMTLVCDNGRAHLVRGQVDAAGLAKGRTLGVCAWTKPG